MGGLGPATRTAAGAETEERVAALIWRAVPRARPRLQRVTAAAGATAGADAGAGRAGPVGYSKQIIPVGLSKWILPDSVPALPVSRTLPRSCVRPRSRTARAGRRQGLVSWPLS